MNILITGVNGLIGNAAADYLINYHTVIGTGRSQHLSHEKNRPMVYCQADITDESSLSTLPEKIDVIVHCAASLNNDPLSSDLIDTNCMGIRNLVKYAIKSKCMQFIYISGIPIIGIPKEIPITETHPVHPQSIYHLTKYFGELFCQNTLHSCKLTILRLPSPIGKWIPDNKIVAVFIKKSILNEDLILAGHGSRIQNYLDVQDAGLAIQLAIEKKAEGIFNIASEHSYSNLDLAQLCIDTFQSKSQIKFQGIDQEEANKWIISTEKAKQILGFQAQIPLQQSLLEISKRLRNNENTIYK